MSYGSAQLIGSTTYWRDLSQRATAGELQIPEETAFLCDEACVAYIDKLRVMIAQSEFIVDVKAFGELDSAQQLGRKFERIAYSGDRSLRVVLGQHIEVIELMRSVFKQYFREADYADRRAAQRLSDVAPHLGPFDVK